MSKKEKVTAIIDSNEESQNERVTEVLVLHEDVEDFRIEPLAFGDIKIGPCLFERKTPSDFASSLEEGRLKEQAQGLAATDMHAYILIEGNMEDFDNLEHTDIPSKSLRGMDARIEATYGVGVKYCSTPELLGDVAVRLARKHIEDPSDPVVEDHREELSFIEHVFTGVEGVGHKTARNLAGDFPDLSTAMRAEPNDFKAVDGVGEKRATEIYDTLHNDKYIPDEKEKESDVVVVTI